MNVPVVIEYRDGATGVIGSRLVARASNSVMWYGCFAPAGTPADRVNWVYEEISKAFATPKETESMAAAHLMLEWQFPTEFAKSVRSDADNARKILGTIEKR